MVQILIKRMVQVKPFIKPEFCEKTSYQDMKTARPPSSLVMFITPFRLSFKGLSYNILLLGVLEYKTFFGVDEGLH